MGQMKALARKVHRYLSEKNVSFLVCCVNG